MFSCDVLASETQSAPLWEAVSKQSDDSTAKKREVKDQNEPRTSENKAQKRSRSPPRRQWWGTKRQRMSQKYTECRLCELNFKNELELEDHLFSILHHRALNTEFGDRRHECNLCGVTCDNLSNYVQHLKNDFHRTKNEKRKAAIEDGTYKRPEHNLARYASSFMHPPARAKQLKIDEEVNKRVDEVFSKERGRGIGLNMPRPLLNQSQRGRPRGHDSYHSYLNPYTWRRPLPEQRQQQQNLHDFPDWHPLGAYGESYGFSDYDVGYNCQNPHRGYNQPQRWDRNPYEGEWYTDKYQRMGVRAYDLEKYVYTNTDNGGLQERNSKKSNSLPATPRVDNQQTRPQSLTRDQTRTKELVARAHEVIRNGHDATKKLKRKKKKKNKKERKNSGGSQKNLNQSTNSARSHSGNSTESFSKSKRVEKLQKSVNQNANSGKSQPGRHSENSTESFSKSKSSKIEKNGKGLGLSPASFANMQRAMAQHYNSTQDPLAKSWDISVSKSRKSKRKGVGDRQQERMNRGIEKRRVTSSANSSMTSEDSHKLSGVRQSVSPNIPSLHEYFGSETRKNLGFHQKNTADMMPKSAQRKINQSVLDKFRKQINKELGPARVKKTPRRPSADSVSSRSSVLSVNMNTLPKQGQRSEPRSTENIRAKFRKILDDIDQPVMSASEVLRNAEKSEISQNGTENSQTTSWAESSRVGKANSDTLNASNSNLSSFSENFTRAENTPVEPTFPPNLTPNTTLPDRSHDVTKERRASTSLDQSSELIRSISIDSERNCITPTRQVTSLSSDMDTPTNKKRQNPQPNLNRARSRITSKQRESPDVPSEVRQAKLKQLLQKYDRTKKNSPDVSNYAKKTSGPRFGIELNLQSRPMDMESLAKQANWVEILPEKRMRSLSESDSMASFTTAATESTTNLSSSINPSNDNARKQMDAQEQQRTSTPVMTPQADVVNLNAKLLVMSEREESLHASVRSLSLQEANMQSEVTKKTAVLRTLQAELEKLDERKKCVKALKRKHEEELGGLRQDRLMLLRGVVPDSRDNASASGNIFQDFTPTCRRRTTTPTGEAVFGQRNATPGNTTPLFTQTSQTTTSMPVQNGPRVRSKLPDFDISKVKSEPGSSTVEEINPFSATPINLPEMLKVKTEKPEDSASVTYNKSPEKSPACEANSTQFYSFSEKNEAPKSATQQLEVDRIVAKYTSLVTNTNHTDSKCGVSSNSDISSVAKRVKKKKSPATPLRKSPRIASKEVEKLQNLPSETPLVSQTQVYTVEEQSKELEDSGDTGKKALPKILKTHELPLIGMHLVDEGLLTCSSDETMALHTTDGKKYGRVLGATPTAMTAVTESSISLVFIATQRVISTKQNSDESVVINKMEHWLDIYIVQSPKTATPENIFLPHNRLRMKTRVLCMCYDKRILFCGMRDGMAAIITLDSLYQLEEDINILECHSHSAITCLTTGMEGARRILCCGSTDCTVSVRDAVEGLLLRTIQGHTKTVTCLKLVHNELYSASVDRLVLCHNLNTGNLLHRFTGHVGVVRALHIQSNIMVTLCSDRNIRFFDTETTRLIQKPKPVSSLPLYACVPFSRNGTAESEKVVWVGCEDSTVIRIQIPQTRQPIPSSPAKNLNLKSPIRTKHKASSKSPEPTINLSGEFQCKWEGCKGVGTFSTLVDLCDHLFDVHIDTSELAHDGGDWTLQIGMCCQWESCTHYFAPELDTVRDIKAHVQRHFKSLPKSPPKQADVIWPDSSDEGPDIIIM